MNTVQVDLSERLEDLRPQIETFIAREQLDFSHVVSRVKLENYIVGMLGMLCQIMVNSPNHISVE